MPTRVRSHCKINLGLAIGPPRKDGFHSLATLYQTLALHDLVTVSARRSSETRIRLTTNHHYVPTDARNTAWKMVEQTLLRTGLSAEVAIHIEKELPVQGGLGGGSANAAAALLGLERELRISLSDSARLALAAEVGSDVPLFLIGGAVLGLGRGEQVSAVPDFPPTACVIAVPGIGVSTPRAFRDWDQRLTQGGQSDTIKALSQVYASVLRSSSQSQTEQPDTSGIVGGPNPKKQRDSSGDLISRQSKTPSDLAENALLALVHAGIENDFEQVVFPQTPFLREIKRELMGTLVDPGSFAMYAALSGSGSTLFGLYGSTGDAEAAQQRVQAFGCKAFVTETLPRQAYWRTMFAE